MNALPNRFCADDVLTREQLAKRLQVDVAATYRWRECPRLRVGREHRFVWGDVVDWLRLRDTQTSTPPRRPAGRTSSTGRGAVFEMPHRAGHSRDAEGRDRIAKPFGGAGSGRLPEGHR